MKLLALVLLAVVIGVPAAKIEKKYNGLAALLAEHGTIVPKRGSVGTRIVGGNPGLIEDIPYIVSLQELWLGQLWHICGGVIISATRALTAAHCTEWFPEYPLYIRAGSTNSRQGGQSLRVESTVDHPAYDEYTLNNDISILHLAGTLDLALPGIAAIALPAQGAGTAAGTSSRVSGWGAFYEDHAGTDFLHYVFVPVITNAQCSALYGGPITAGMLCAGFPEGGRDACQGDSGGPLTAGNQVIGLVSWGYGCARPNLPGVYARVSHYRDWIDSNV